MNLLQLNALKITSENVTEMIQLFLDDSLDLDRAFRNKLLFKLKKFFIQDIILWERIKCQFELNLRNDQVPKQLNVIILIFMDSDFGIAIVREYYDLVWAKMMEQIPILYHAFESQDWLLLDSKDTYHFLKPLLAMLIKFTVKKPVAETKIDQASLFKVILQFMNGRLNIETRMLASIIAGTLLLSHTTENPFYLLQVLNQSQKPSQSGLISFELYEYLESNLEGQILIIGGILQTNPSAIVESLKDEQDLNFILALFEKIIGLIQNNSDTRMQSFSFQAIARWFAVVKELPGNDGLLKELNAGDQFGIALELVLGRWEDPTVTQQKLRELFGCICDLVVSNSLVQDQLFKMIKTLGQIKNRKGKFDLLAILVPRISSRPVLELVPDILEQAFAVLDKPSVNSSATTFINQIMKKMNTDKVSLDSVTVLIVDSLLSEELLTRKIVSGRILPRLGQLMPSLFDDIISRIQSKPLSEYSYEAIVSILKAAKGVGHQPNICSRPEYNDILKMGISSSNSRLRFQTFSFITESNQSAKDVTKEEMEYVKEFLVLNGGGDTVDARQQVIAQMHKFLERLKRCLYKNMREEISIVKKIKAFPDLDALAGNLNEVKSMMEEKKAFFEWIRSFAITGLYPGSSFARTITSVAFLSLLRDIDDLKVDVTASLQVPKLFQVSESDIQVLFSQITFDTVAGNRQELLKYIQLLDLPCNADLEEGVEMMKRLGYLLVSERAADSDIAASSSRLILARYVKIGGQFLSFEKTSAEKSPVEHYFDQHLQMLRKHILEAEKNLVIASQRYPLNSIILVLSGLIQDIDLKDSKWDSFIIELTNLCIRSCELTEGVCADASPEGNLPEEYRNSPDRQKISQILLRHCFRTIKNATYCFIEILSKLEFNSTPEQAKFVTKLGDLMCQLLTNVRHKGAFSSVQENFSLLCKLLSNSKQYNHVPKDWLHHFLAQIGSLQVSVTRRSAGLPSAILAILVSPNNDSDRTQLFKLVVDTCYSVISTDQVREEQLDLPQVHAMNVLRILMADSDLVFMAREHMGTCFEICIKQFSSHIFPIRNCAAMLFSTLVSKAFGTKKTKSEGEQVNLVFGREFFLKFPRLYELLLKQLKEAVQVIDENQVHPLLYPVLSLLSRLKPFGNEVEASFYSLRPFESLVLKCSKAVQWKVREISAQTVGVLVDSSRVLAIIEQVVTATSSSSTNSYLHGSLLQIEAVLDQHAIDCHFKDAGFYAKLNQLLVLLVPLLTFQRFSVARYVFLRIGSKYIEHMDDALTLQVRTLAHDVLFGRLSAEYCPNYIFPIAASLVCSTIVEGNITTVPSNGLIPLLQALAELEDSKFAAIQQSEFIQSCTDFCSFIATQIDCDPELLRAALLFLRKTDQLSTIDFVNLLNWLHKPAIPFALVCVLLDTVALLITKSNDWTKYLDRCDYYSQPQLPFETRTQVAESLAYLKEHISKTHKSFVTFAMLLDHLAQDEEESIRLVAVKTMSYYLQDPIIRCDVLTRNRFLQFLCSECDDVDDLLESLLDRLEVVKFGSVQDALKPTLFDPEDLNTFKESIVDVFMVSGCLEKLSTRLSSDKITGRLQQLVQEFLQLSTMPDFNWLTNSAQVFDLGLQAIASAHLLSTFGDSDPLAKLAALKMHPFLKQIVDRNQWNSIQWYFLIK